MGDDLDKIFRQISLSERARIFKRAYFVVENDDLIPPFLFMENEGVGKKT